MPLTQRLILGAAALLVAAGLCLFAGSLAADGAPTRQPSVLSVVITPLTPFVVAQGNGHQGFSLDLWQGIATRQAMYAEHTL